LCKRFALFSEMIGGCQNWKVLLQSCGSMALQDRFFLRPNGSSKKASDEH